MTSETAKQVGIASAQEAYRQWDREEPAAEVVMRYAARMDAALQSSGLTKDDDDLLATAGEAYRAEAESLFGNDYVVAGQ